MDPVDGGARGGDPGLDTTDLTDQSESIGILVDPTDARRAGLRLAYRLAVSRYRRQAILRPTPAGPAACPSTCGYCARRRLA
jgi:L-lysine 2,3-aminomutase